MPQRSITWTQRLHDAAKVIAAEPAPSYAPSIKERAQECIDHLRPGQVLPVWQVEIVQQLRSRLGYPNLPSYDEFQAAFGEAWEAGQ